jgi:carbonic anhydrase
MTSSDDLIRDARAASGSMSKIPKRHQAVLTCMDTRLDPLRMLNAGAGDLHVIRNAGGLVTEDTERSLILSQRRLETRRIDVIMHTSCGVYRFDEDTLTAEIRADGGETNGRFGSFDDLEQELRRGVTRLRANTALGDRSQIRGYIYDLSTSTLRLVADA